VAGASAATAAAVAAAAATSTRTTAINPTADRPTSHPFFSQYQRLRSRANAPRVVSSNKSHSSAPLAESVLLLGRSDEIFVSKNARLVPLYPLLDVFMPQ
jgi:hypothetical protein